MRKRKGARGIIKLLFIGFDWKRKGGDIAYETMIDLNNRGLDTRLVVCGSSIPHNIKHLKLETVHCLNKNDKKESLEFYKLYEDASFFILPTRNECFGLVFAEAAAYCLPVISTNTGGVSDYVENGVMGDLLSLSSNAKEYTDSIVNIWNDKTRYLQFCFASRKKFEEELNWDSWGKEVSKVLSAKINNKREP
jgi:glycosyltransferase involved in cell wall biosynthesis